MILRKANNGEYFIEVNVGEALSLMTHLAHHARNRLETSSAGMTTFPCTFVQGYTKDAVTHDTSLHVRVGGPTP